jgi:glycosyltransferase involved in cell wall biosynthesis
MRILQVSNFFKPLWETGGVTKVNYEISKNLVQKGHDVTVYTTDGYKPYFGIQTNQLVKVDEIKVYYFTNLFKRVIKRTNLTFPYYLPFVLRKEIRNFDVIHIHEHRTLLAACVHYYAKKYNVPYVLQAHGSVLPHFQKQGLKMLFDIIFGYSVLKDASKLIALTDTEAKQYIQMGIDESKICIIPNGIDLKEYENLPEKGEFRKKYSIKENEKIILYLGRIDKIKGIDLLIDAFSQLKLELNNVKLVIVGPKNDYFSILNENVKNLNLNDFVLFTGPLYGRDKRAAYVDADVYVLPSRYETFPNTVLEACLCGTPVIVTDRCGISDIVVNYKLGSVVKFDKTQLKCAIVQFLNEKFKNDAFCDCVPILKDSFDWSSILVKIECLYKGIKEETQRSTSSSNDI